MVIEPKFATEFIWANCNSPLRFYGKFVLFLGLIGILQFGEMLIANIKSNTFFFTDFIDKFIGNNNATTGKRFKRQF